MKVASRVTALRGCLLSTGAFALRAVLAPDAALTAEEGGAVCVYRVCCWSAGWALGSASTFWPLCVSEHTLCAVGPHSALGCLVLELLGQA